MQPAARIQAAIDLVTEIESAAFENGLSTDDVVRNFFRKRRYAGSKDRRAVTTLALDCVRHRAADEWRLGGQLTPRLRVALRLAVNSQDWQFFFAGEGHGPAPLTSEEQHTVVTAASRDIVEAPAYAQLNFPSWLEPHLTARFGDRLPVEMAALQERAGVTLRVNTLKTERAKAMAALADQGFSMEETPLSPLGLKTAAGSALTETEAFKKGWVEIQDEAAQICGLLTEATPGQQVIDLCAGAGGKTLAIAAMMANKGQIYAFDNDRRRLKPMEQRLQRAGVRNAQAHVLSGEDDPVLAELRGKANVVLVDSPCSGSGTWRRDPALPWRITPERLEAFAETQINLLRQAVRLTAPGGEIVYATCSIFSQENEDVIGQFLSDHSDWRLVPYKDVWTRQIGSAVPDSLSALDGALQFSPGTHGTDGFFVAVLKAPD